MPQAAGMMDSGVAPPPFCSRLLQLFGGVRASTPSEFQPCFFCGKYCWRPRRMALTPWAAMGRTEFSACSVFRLHLGHLSFIRVISSFLTVWCTWLLHPLFSLLLRVLFLCRANSTFRVLDFLFRWSTRSRQRRDSVGAVPCNPPGSASSF